MRDPQGNVLEASNDCVITDITTYTSKCSAVDYTHNPSIPSFGTVYVSVYLNTFDRVEEKYLCSTSTSGSRNVDYLFTALAVTSAVPTCDFNLVCYESISVSQGASLTARSLVDTANSDICNVNLNSVNIIDSNGFPAASFSTSCSYGLHEYSVSIYGQSCTTTVSISAPDIDVYCPSSWTIFPNYLVSKCSFGTPCDIDPYKYSPDISIDFEGCYDGYSVEIQYEYGMAEIGDIVSYDVTVTTDSGASDTATCYAEYFGIVPQSLYAFEIDSDDYAYLPEEPVYIFNDDEIYFDTIYRIEFYYDGINFGWSPFRDLEPGFNLYLIDPSDFLTDGSDNVYVSPDYVDFDDTYCPNTREKKRAQGDCQYCCYTSVDFCIPSDNSRSRDLETGKYKLVIAADNGNIIGSGSVGLPQPRLPNPPAKRSGSTTPLDNYVISLGNPFVTLTVNPFQNDITPGCAAFYCRDNNPDCFP